MTRSVSAGGATLRRSIGVDARRCAVGAKVAVLLLALLSTGCEPEAKPRGRRSELPAPLSPAQAPLNDRVDFFEVTPGAIGRCPESAPVIANVTWQASDLAVAVVRVEVANKGEAGRVLLSEAGRAGSVATGAWVVAGTAFFLVDALTGEDLASAVVAEVPCGWAPTPPG